ncbi:hypothetical protein K501DRAFT_278706 [Backusella circina FSU 941]|nr:hypothetical protein K501DRAFT_278706 [Backusella circina FSU 941]
MNILYSNDLNAYYVSNFKNTVQVNVKIGREFLQIITVREQEIFSNLSAVLNSVYKMTDITDIFLPAIPPNKKASNEGEIHILHEGGKSTLVLVVSNREEVYKYLWERKQSLVSNKKHEEDGIRPNDVPGRILNLAMLNLGGDDPALRLAAYNLLYSLCISFRFSIAQKLMHASDLCVPFNSTDFAKNISEGLAASEPHLTLEFLSECIVVFTVPLRVIAQGQTTVTSALIKVVHDLSAKVSLSQTQPSGKVNVSYDQVLSDNSLIETVLVDLVAIVSFVVTLIEPLDREDRAIANVAALHFQVLLVVKTVVFPRLVYLSDL